MEDRSFNTAESTEHSISHESCELALKTCAEHKERLAQQLAYLNADFENVRKRTEKDRVLWSVQAQADVIKRILPIVDDFDRAFQHSYTDDVQNHLKGFELVYKSLQKILKEMGVEEIPAISFDPELHEAIMQVQDPEKESGSIHTVIQKGYTYKNIVLRPAHVSVVA